MASLLIESQGQSVRLQCAPEFRPSFALPLPTGPHKESHRFESISIFRAALSNHRDENSTALFYSGLLSPPVLIITPALPMKYGATIIKSAPPYEAKCHAMV